MSLFKQIKSIFRSKNDSSRNTWSEKELLDFQNNLRQVIAWTEEISKNFDCEKGKYGFVLRQTNLIHNGIPLYKFGKQSNEIANLNMDFDFGEDYCSWNSRDDLFDEYDLLLQEAIKNRTKNRQVDLSEVDKLGRILSFQTCITTHDGAPVIESRNFVDESDVPPIDTWFYLKRNYYHSEYICNQSLFCWIPKKFENVMQQAMDVEILDSYRWFDENNKDIYEQIKKQ